MVKRSEVLDETYGAVAHASRRAILDILRGGPMRVTDVAQGFPVSLAAISRHVRVLEAAGLVSRSVVGRDHMLSLEPRPLITAGEWIDVHRAFWEGRLDALESHLREEK